MINKGDEIFGNNKTVDQFGEMLKLLKDAKDESENSLASIVFWLIAILLFLAISIPISYLWLGFVLMTLWNWFMPAIGMATIGLALPWVCLL